MERCLFPQRKQLKDCIKEVKEKLANKVKQYRFYSSGAAENQPSRATATAFASGSVFNTLPTTQLGVQSLPGTKCYLNEGAEPILIGSTGIYELDLNNSTEISKITFDVASINTINNSAGAYLIVDILYDDGEED